MKNQMQKETYNHIRKNLPFLKLDIENGELLSPHSVNYFNGYQSISLKGKSIFVHQIFAVALFGEECVGLTVDFIDGNKENFRQKNLRMVTDDVNNKLKETKKKRIRCNIKMTDILTGKTEIFKSQKEACRVLGLVQKNVWLVLEGKMEHTHGYKFERMGA